MMYGKHQATQHMGQLQQSQKLLRHPPCIGMRTGTPCTVPASNMSPRGLAPPPVAEVGARRARIDMHVKNVEDHFLRRGALCPSFQELWRSHVTPCLNPTKRYCKNVVVHTSLRSVWSCIPNSQFRSHFLTFFNHIKLTTPSRLHGGLPFRAGGAPRAPRRAHVSRCATLSADVP